MAAMFMRALLTLLATALLAACAATPEAPLLDDAMAKRFESAPGSAIIYLYRADTPGGTGSSTLWLDGRLVGESLPRTYFRVSVRPGMNRLTGYSSDTARLEFETRGGEVYFIAISRYGDDGAGISHFRAVPAETGMTEIKRCCSLLETWKPGQNRMPL